VGKLAEVFLIMMTITEQAEEPCRAEGEENLPAAPDLAAAPEAAVELTEAELFAAVEAILFAAPEPLRGEVIARTLGKTVSAAWVAEAIARLNEFYLAHGRAFTVDEVAGKYVLLTRPEFGDLVEKLSGGRTAAPEKLSPATLDTLAIIAYKQPLTRLEIETIRGVACGQILRQLMERELVKVVGKKMEALGYPSLYGTTENFLREFGLASLAALPLLEELQRMNLLTDTAAAPPAVVEA
jgi:segregation and condensation protein B